MNKEETNIGIYGIFYKDDCLYIGQSVNIVKRIKTHKQKLNILKHNVKEFNDFMVNNKLTTSDLDFTQLINIKYRDQKLLNLYEVKMFQYWRPKFYGQSPSSKNNYTKVIVNPEISFNIGETIKTNNTKTRTGVTKRVDGRTIWIKRCINCDKIFDGTAPTSTYCSDTCYMNFKYFLKHCPDCNITFQAKHENTTYCQSCKYKYNKPKESFTFICKNCDKKVITVYARQKFCSEKCKSTYFNNTKLINKICSTCESFYMGINNSKRCSSCKESNLYKITCKNIHCNNVYINNAPKTGYCAECKKVSCKNCGQKFTQIVKESYCSIECKPKSKTELYFKDIYNDFTNGRTISAISIKYEMSESQVKRCLSKNIEYSKLDNENSLTKKRWHEELNDIKIKEILVEIINKYDNWNDRANALDMNVQSLQELSAKYGLHVKRKTDVVDNFLKKYGVDFLTHELTERYINGLDTADDLAKEFGLSVSSFKRAVEKLNIISEGENYRARIERKR